MTSEFNFSAHSPQFVRGPLDGSAWNIPPTVEAVEMQVGALICRYKRIDRDTFLYVRSLPPTPKKIATNDSPVIDYPTRNSGDDGKD